MSLYTVIWWSRIYFFILKKFFFLDEVEFKCKYIWLVPGGYKAENNLPSIAETFQISIVDVFLTRLLLKYTNKQ